MIERYTRPEMAHIWSEENKYRQWLEVELAATEALAETGEVPPKRPACCASMPSFDLERIQAIEREVKHDVIAFTTAVSESMARRAQADASRWLHYGLTSNDVVDTAQALMVRSASELILRGLTDLAAALKARAFEFKERCRSEERTVYTPSRSLSASNSLCGTTKCGAIWRAFRPPRRKCGSEKFRARWELSGTSARRPRSASASGWGCGRRRSLRR